MGLGSWEQREANKVFTYTIHVEQTTVAWAFGLRRLRIPGPDPIGITGLPFDHARNHAVEMFLQSPCEWCLRGDAIIETSQGGKPIRDIKVGEYVKTHTGRFCAVTAAMRRPYPQRAPLVWVSTPHGLTKCTPEHPFFVSRAGSPGRFIVASDLKVGDEILYPDEPKLDRLQFGIRYNTLGENDDAKVGAKKNGQVLDWLPVTEDIARFLGLYAAEGCGGEDGITFTIGNHETELLEFISRMTRDMFGRRVSVTKRWATHAVLNIRPLGELFRAWFGHTAHEKRIPPFVFGWSLKNRLSFLRGYLDGDGHVSGSRGLPPKGRPCPVVGFSTVSDQLVDDIIRLCSMNGIRVKKYRAPANTSVMKDGNVINSGPHWKCWFAIKSSRKIADLLASARDGDYLKIPITSVVKKHMPAVPNDQHVYNLEVAEDNSYIADSTTVHNCFSLDSDVIAPPDTIHRLLAWNKPIISGMYCRRSPPHGVPVMMRNHQWVTELPSDPRNPLVEVDLVGAGCMLVHRSIFERLLEVPHRPGKPWFDWRVDLQSHVPVGEALSEDFAFNLAVRRHLRETIWVDTSVRCLHVGNAQANYGTFVPLGAA